MDDNDEEFRKKTHSRSVSLQQAWERYSDAAKRAGRPVVPYALWVLGKRGKVAPFPMKTGEEEGPQPSEPDTPEPKDD